MTNPKFRVRRPTGAATVNQLWARSHAQGDGMSTLSDEIKALRTSWAVKAAPLHQELEALALDDGKPAEFRSKERARLVAGLQAVRDQTASAADEWAKGVAIQAAALRGSEPILKPEEETAALRDQLKAERLARTFTTKRDASNDLLPRADRAIRLGNLREAKVLMEAAQIAGAFGIDQVLIPLNEALDRTVPARIEARRLEDDGAALHQALRADISGDAAGVSEVSARVAELAGDTQAAMEARRTWAATSASQKVRAYVTQGSAEADGGLVAPVLTPAPEGAA